MHDLRLALRALRATPIVSLVAVLSLALGIGANTAIFSLVNSLLLRSLPVADPQRLVSLNSWEGQRFNRNWMYETWIALRDRAQDFDGAFATGEYQLRLTDRGETREADGLIASGDFFATLGLRPVAGRFFTPADDVRGGGPNGPVAVISYGMWQQRFGGDPTTIGRSVRINDAAFTIIGVAPPPFFGVEVGRRADVIVPMETEPILHPNDPMIGNPGGPIWLRILLRLKPGSTIETATTTLRALQPSIRDNGIPPALLRFPEVRRTFLKSPFVLASAANGQSYMRTQYMQPLLLLFGIVALVLLIACANIANLQLARATARRHEMSVRRALGASRWRLARQLFVESMLIATIGAGGGLLLARWGSRALLAQLTSLGERAELDLALDWRVLAFTAAVTMLTATIFGTSPAWRAARVEPIEALKEQGRQTAGGSRANVSNGLVVAQVALSLVLLVVAGLFVRTFERLTHATLGFDSDRLLLVNVDSGKSAAGARDRGKLYQQLVEAAARVPGVSHASGAAMAPFGSGGVLQIKMPNDPASGAAGAEAPKASVNMTTPDWFATYGIPLREGRDLNDRDTAQSPFVMLVNEAFVRRFVPAGQRALDQRVGLALGGGALGTRTIVGVVGDSVHSSIREVPGPEIYLPWTQWDFPIPLMQRMYVSVRAPAGIPPATLTTTVSAALKSVDSSVGLMAHTLDTDVWQSFALERLIATLAGGFGVLALLLATIGLYGVTAYTVSRRHMEIGIRLALGSTPAGVVRMVLARVAWLVAIGVVVGAAASVWIAQFAAPLLFGVTPRDPATLATAAVILAVIGALAGGLPAARASRLDPARVLRAH